jgi:hypothetical protein
MPVLHKRKSENGYYLKGQIEGGFVTLQLIDSAERFMIRDLGYSSDSNIPWKLITPLCMLGHIYTKTGNEPSSKVDIDGIGKAINKLDYEQRAALKSYLRKHGKFSQEERHWVNNHLFSGEAISEDQVCENKETGSPPIEIDSGTDKEKLDELHEVWESVTGDQANTSPGMIDGIDPFPSRLVVPGYKANVKVNRISQANNAIVSVDDGSHINLGNLVEVSSGDVIPCEILSSQFGRCLDENYIPPEYNIENKVERY